MSIGVMDENFRLSGNSIFHDRRQRTIIQAKLDTIGSDVVKHIFATSRSNGLLGGVAGDPFRALVPVGNDAVAVDEINPLVKVIDNLFIEILVHGFYFPSNS